VFQIAIPTGYAWLRAWNENGCDGISHPFHESDRPVGRPSKLDEEDLRTLKRMLEERADWETKDVCRLIAKTWGIELSDSQVRRILKKKLKMHCSKPYCHDYRRPADAQDVLELRLDEAYNKLYEKGFKDEEIAVGFVDESSPQTTANTVRFWHFGHGEIIKNTSKYKANAIGFYAIRGHSTNDFLADSKKESIGKFFGEIREANRDYKAIIVVLDNCSSHIAGHTKEQARENDIELVYLPPYSPDLNPIEFIWKTIKRCVSANFIESLPHLREIISVAWDANSRKCSFAKEWIAKFLSAIIPYRELCG